MGSEDRKIQNWIQRAWNVETRYIRINCNVVADRLTRLGADSPTYGLQIIERPNMDEKHLF